MSVPGWSYSTVEVSFWDDQKVRGWSEDGRHLAIYLLTCSHRTSEGFYRLPISLAIDDLKWTRERWDAAMAELVETGFAAYDEPSRLVLIVKGLKYHYPIRGIKTITGALNAIEQAKGSRPLFERFLAAADRYQPEFASAIRTKYELHPKGLDMGLPELASPTPTPTPLPAHKE